MIFRSVRWWILIAICKPFLVHYVKAAWPTPNPSSIQLLGLFEDAVNASAPIELAVHARAMFKAAILLSQQYNITIDGQLIEWNAAQTGGHAIDAISDTCEVVSASHTVGIVGPALSREVPIIADFTAKVRIPVVSYGATDPDLSDRNAYPTFYRTVPSDNAAALGIVKLFFRFNWTTCTIIYQNDAFGSGGAKAINEEFIRNNLTVINTIVFDIRTRSFRDNLKNSLTSGATRIVLLWAESKHTSLILQKALDADVLGPHFTWILSSSVPLTSFNQTISSKLIGMLTVEPSTAVVVNGPINTTLLNAAYEIWRQYESETFPQTTEVNEYALFAFDATWLLIQSLQQFCLTISNNSSSCISFDGASFCFKRHLLNSDVLLDTINSLKLVGVSGPLQFNINTTDRVNGSYYFAQNAQASSNGISFVPVLDYSDYEGWQVTTEARMIVWPGTSLVSPTDNAKLDGVRLRIGIGGSVPFTILSTVKNQFGRNVTEITGYVPELVELLRKRMGFVPDIQLVPSDQTNSVLIYAVANGTYDILVGDVTVTANRRKIVDFSSAMFDTSTYIVMRNTGDVSIDLLSFLKPFSRNLWLLTLAAIVYAAILICVLEREANETLRNRSIVSLCAMSVWYCFGTLVGYGADFDANTAAGRLLTVGLYILSIVLVASYTANLASDLVLLKSRNVISGIDDIKSGKMPFNRIGIIADTSIEDYYLREVSRGIRNYHPLKSPTELLDGLVNGIIDACFLDSCFSEYLTNNIYCNLTLVGQSFDTGIFGIAIPKQWLYALDLDVNILALRESGDLDKLNLKWFQTKNCPDSYGTSTALEIESMSGLFLTFGAISILSLLLFAWNKRLRIKNIFHV